MTRFSLISDMHIDFPQPRTPYDKLEENVIIAGDTSNGLEGLKFLQKLKNKGFNVYAVDGNHEHYSNMRQGRSPQETTARFREEHKRYHDNDPIPVVLANGWYHVDDGVLWAGYMNDSRMGNLSQLQVNASAAEDAKTVGERLQEWKNHQRKGIVVTHTAPCLDTLNPQYEGHFSNDWYWNPAMEELLKEFSEQIHIWCHGHSHAFADKIVHGVKVVCNPRGYPGENINWEPFNFEINT